MPDSKSNLLLNQMLDLAAYQFHLPESLIAQKPVEPRDASRLLVLHRKDQRIEHRQFQDLPNYLDQNDLLVLNNTRVLKARMLGHRIVLKSASNSEDSDARSEKGGRVEFVMLEQIGGPTVWEGLFKASARAVPGFEFLIPTQDGRGLRGKILKGSSESATGTVVAEFDRNPIESGAGEIPLPHYMKRDPNDSDESSYQTVYAKALGSAAAPTAGLHFTQNILNRIKIKGAEQTEVTLHTGLGTFRPVKVQDIRQHAMHEERYVVSPETAHKVTDWKRSEKRVLAVGTTSVRTLESAWDKQHKVLKEGEQRTSIFIHPGSEPIQVVDRLLTNFHLPGSTLLMLVSAFAGHEFTMAAYQEAVKQKYRFFSYGDAMLIL